MSKSEEFRRLKEEAERRIMAAEEEANRGRGMTETVSIRSATNQKIELLEQSLAAKEREIQTLEEEKQNAIDQCQEALLAAAVAESLVKEYSAKLKDYDVTKAKLKELEACEAKLQDYNQLLDRIRVLEETEKRSQEEFATEREKLVEENARLRSESEKLQTILVSTSSHIKLLEAKYDKLKRRYKEKKRKSDPNAQVATPTAAAPTVVNENGTSSLTTSPEVERLQLENSKLKQAIATKEESLSKLRIRQSLRIEVKVVRVIDTGFTPFGMCVNADGNLYIGNLKRSQVVHAYVAITINSSYITFIFAVGHCCVSFV
eukprot:TRINITY_DN3793_c0_g1_i1.p1 TRINITY_DN3793_c0_g1~~TRINITY_DN3793_c0_g1_i1.p1  ORF type:complete len:318 (-),score=69.11 TRINITY_DN3793_c0_g1_i1:742-1695(-)